MKNKYDIVTSFNPKGLEVYARNMLNSFDKHWDKDIQLHAWYHDFEEAAFYRNFKELDVPSKGVKYSNLNNIQDMLDYRESMKVHNGTEGGKIQYNWRLDAIKWCHKIYALTETASDPHLIGQRLAHLVRR